MKLTITRENLLAVSSRAASFTSRKNITPILSYALVSADDDRLTICATDMEKQIVESVEAEISITGEVVIPVAQVAEIAKKLPIGALVDISCDDATVTIKSGKYKTKLNTLPVADFPALNESETTCSFEVPASTLKTQLQNVMFAMSSEETRYYLCGVHIHTDGEKLKFVATDGHRLAVSRITGLDIKGNLSEGVIVPRAVVSDIVRLLDGNSPVKIYLSDTRIIFQIANATITVKLIDGKFPEYRRVIPRGNDKTVVISPEISKVIDRVAAVSDQRSKPVKFTFGDNEITLSCEDGGGNTASDRMDIEGSIAIDIGFQAKYVLDMLSSVKGNSVWSFADSSAPTVVKDSDNDDVLFVIMPMRV